MVVNILKKEMPVARISHDHPSITEGSNLPETENQNFLPTYNMKLIGYQQNESPMVTGGYGPC